RAERRATCGSVGARCQVGRAPADGGRLPGRGESRRAAGAGGQRVRVVRVAGGQRGAAGGGGRARKTRDEQDKGGARGETDAAPGARPTRGAATPEPAPPAA